MMHQAPNGAQNRRFSSVLSKSAKASALACLAFALAPSLTFAADATTPAPAAAAASAKTGSVYGKVTNAATGAVMTRAKVTVEGTDIETFTDEFGEYRLELPEGTTNIKVSYTGMKDKVLDVEVLGGETMMQDFNIVGMSIASTGKGKDEIVTLDAFSVTEGRETNAYNIANNEQRYSVNIKSVVAADAFGDVTEGNVGEFIKYLPGISVDYVAADVRTINVRGFSSQFTNIAFNGMRVTSAASGSNSRMIELEQISINNIARAEVSKVPTPDQAADSLGGNVNMISKNSFERKGVSFNWKAYASINAENLTFKQTPGPKDKNSLKMLPGVDFDLTVPFTKNFGIVLTGLSSNQYNEQHRSQMTWQFNQPLTSAGVLDTTKTAATPANPHINQYEWQDGPKTTARNSISVRADWRIARGHTLNVGYQNNFYNNFFGNRNMRYTIGNTIAGKATAINGIVPTSVINTTWNTNKYVESGTGLGSVTQGSSYRNKNGQTQAGDIYYRMKVGDWEADAGLHTAVSKSWYRDLGRGFFNNVATQMYNATTVRLENIDYPAPTVFIVKDQKGNVIDQSNLSNFYVRSANTAELDGKATMKGGFANLKRTFDLAIPVGVKTGFAIREEDRDNVRHSVTYDFVGADGKTATADDNAAAYASKVYTNQKSYWGIPNQAWVSAEQLSDLIATNPGYFAIQKGGADAYVYDAQNSVYIKEKVSAAFLQFDTKLLRNKMTITTGLRFEKTEVEGDGLLFTPENIYQRNTDGSFVLSGGKRVRKTEAGAAGSLAEKKMMYFARGKHAEDSYNGYYPSLHINYNLTDDLIVRAAYAKTYGRPDFADIIPNISIPDTDLTNLANNVGGTITVSNPGLQPWEADNVDLSLEYYHTKGGSISTGVFRKYLSNFWGTNIVPVTEDVADSFGIDYETYKLWQVSSKTNVGDARISGLEFSLVQPLSNFGSWGKSFNVIANGTWLKLDGPNGADFKNFITRTGNIGITYSKKPFVVMLKLNMRGRQRFDKQTGSAYFNAMPSRLTTDTDATWAAKQQAYSNYALEHGGTFYEYYRARNFLDLNFEYQMTKKLSFFANVRNALNKAQDLIRENDVSAQAAGYASQYRTEEYGLQWAVGIKGKF